MIVCAASSATAPAETAGAVLVSGSYGGIYNAWHAVRKGAKAAILSDAGVGKNRAGISGLAWLDDLGIAGATADCMSCHIGDGDHIRRFGRISFVNKAAAALGCAVGDSAEACARRMERAAPQSVTVPAIEGGRRYDLLVREDSSKVIGLDAAPMLVASDAGCIAITGSHAALFRGQPDNVITVPLRAAYFNDAGVGLDDAGIRRLADLDARGMPSSAISCLSAEIGNAHSAWTTGVISHVNTSAHSRGLRPGMTVQNRCQSCSVMSMISEDDEVRLGHPRRGQLDCARSMLRHRPTLEIEARLKRLCRSVTLRCCTAVQEIWSTPSRIGAVALLGNRQKRCNGTQ